MRTALFIIALLLSYMFGMNLARMAHADTPPISPVRFSGGSIAACVRSTVIQASNEPNRGNNRHPVRVSTRRTNRR